VRPRLKLACLLFSLVALLGVAAAASAGNGDKQNGTLAVRSGRGTFYLENLQGSVIGSLDRGKVTIEDPDTTGSGPIVRGADWVRVKSNTTVTYGGKGIRFRILGGRSTVRIESSVGVELSVVGRGRVMLKGGGFAELGLSNGEYSMNGSPFVAVPDMRTWLQLKAPPRQPPRAP
jgi:hypothetical protein